MRREKIKKRAFAMAVCGVALLSCALCVSCVGDAYDGELENQYAKGKVGVELSLRTLSIGGITSDSETYVIGADWENYIDIAGGDYRVYFFTYDPTTETAGNGTSGTLIAEFKPTTIYSTDQGTYTTYTMSGDVDEGLIESLNNFKVVVIANWGVDNYPTVREGETTIDDICDAGKFSAFVQNGVATMPSSILHIPFFGVREYSGVEFANNKTTVLNGNLTLLRALAKVEVILTNANGEDRDFEEVSVVNYNARGYCAPTGVYLKGDYDHDGVWSSDFVDSLHLWNNSNDTGTKTVEMRKIEATTNTLETWTCYLTEYDNSGDDYSYISVKTTDGGEHKVYFSNYTDGKTSTTADYDVCRDNLYRYYITFDVSENTYSLSVNVWAGKWERLFDNEYTFNKEDEGDEPEP